MLEDKSTKFKQIFLLAFTRELIKASGKEFFVGLEAEKEAKKEEIKEKVKNFIKSSKPKEIKKLQELASPFKPLPSPFTINRPPRRLVIPKPNFPSRLGYLQPVASNEEIDLGKLNKLVKDPVVKIIECNGANEDVIVRVPNERKTGIELTKEEIDSIIKIFSEKAKIPAEEGVFRVAVGNLLFSAIISDVVGSKFIIKKIPPRTPQYNYQRATSQLMPPQTFIPR